MHGLNYFGIKHVVWLYFDAKWILDVFFNLKKNDLVWFLKKGGLENSLIDCKGSFCSLMQAKVIMGVFGVIL